MQLDQLSSDIANALWHIDHDRPDRSFQMWPITRNESKRVSEQELKIMIPRAANVVQLAAAIELAGAGRRRVFACYDYRLLGAAAREESTTQRDGRRVTK